jgi:tetratricopeptide (TPR) repeat protein
MRLASRRPAALAALALGLSCPLATAQDDPHAACAAVGWVPRAVLERPVALRTGIGRTHEAVTTQSPEAQAFHDQGLAYLHSYVWIEAARSFNQALRLDPRTALAWVGLSRAYSGLEDGPAARAALEKAQAVSSGVSEKERRKVALRALQLDAIDDLQNPAKHAEYKRALDEALAQDMDDVELWLLRGNTEERNASGRGQRGGPGSIAFYRQALAVSPDHFAAHHFLVHSYETIGQIDKALAHGEVYARQADAIPHAHHMWGHDLRRVGRVEDAIAAFQKAYDLETAYYRAENLGAELDWHRAHNLDLLATCYQHQGRMRTTEQTMRERVRLRPVMAITEFNRKAWPGFLLATARPQEALEAARLLSGGQWHSSRAMGHALAGQALLALGRVEEARKELGAARDELAQVPATSGYLGYSRAFVEPYVDAARGELLLRTGERDAARTLLKEVQARIRAIPGPDAWMEALFSLEEIARRAREVGDWELAEYTAGQMRDHDAAYAGTHYALGLVAEHKGDRSAARQAFAEAVRLWAKADSDLPELREARARGAALAPAAGGETGASPR